MSKKWIFPVIALAGLIIFPWVAAAYPLSIMTEIFIYGIFVASLNLLIGYTGLVSFGHAAFFGIGAYAAGIIGKLVSANLFFTLTSALIISAFAALLIGFFVIKANGFFFLMLTLAFSQMVYAIAYQWEGLTGGTNGFSGIARPELWGFNFNDSRALYYLILVISILIIIGLYRFLSSPVGHTLIGIRENEGRLRSMGYNTDRYKLLAFVIAGGLGGIAGGLYAYFNGFVSPQEIYWTMSGHAIIMVIIGGVGTLAGPFLGAGFLLIFQSVISSYTERWSSIVGLAFIAFVIFAPKGIMGLVSGLRNLKDKEKKTVPGQGGEQA